MMKKKIKIKFLDDKPKEFEIKIRDNEYLDIVSKNKSNVIKSKKLYSRKRKHRGDIWN